MNARSYAALVSADRPEPNAGPHALEGVEQYPIPGRPAPPWASERRRRYLAELNRLFLAGEISQRDLDRTIAEREAAVRRYAGSHADESSPVDRDPTLGATPSAFPSYLDGRLEGTAQPAEGWQ